MHNRHYNKNRAPKIGSSTFFSNKQEREAFRSKQYWEKDELAARPHRTASRKYERKCKESKLFKYRFYIESYQELTKFKSFIYFLNKKEDISFNLVDNNNLVPEALYITKGDLQICNAVLVGNSAYGNSDAINKHLNTAIVVFIEFTNKQLTINLFKELFWNEDLIHTTTPYMYSNQEHVYMNNVHIETKLKNLLMLINDNIKKPKYK